jgi:hypothetical protein
MKRQAGACAKCGGKRAKLRFVQDSYYKTGKPEYLECSCKRCGWKWEMSCADAPTVVAREVEILAEAHREVAEICDPVSPFKRMRMLTT